jgi:hypothetical protein
MAKSCWQTGGGSCGALKAPPGVDMPGPAGDIPGEPGMPGMPPNCAAAGHSGIAASANANGRVRMTLMMVCLPRPPDSTPPIPRPWYYLVLKAP